jgi:F1F0 ATPase subunit 2
MRSRTLSDLFGLVLSFGAGLLAGVLFFGGLWWTVRAGSSSRHPEVWFLVSSLARMAVAFATFYWVSAGHWPRLIVCLLGFLAARIIVVKLVHRSAPPVAREAEARPEQLDRNASDPHLGQWSLRVAHKIASEPETLLRDRSGDHSDARRFPSAHGVVVEREGPCRESVDSHPDRRSAH